MHELQESGGYLLGDQVSGCKPAAAQLVPIPGHHAHSSCSNRHFSADHSLIDVRVHRQAPEDTARNDGSCHETSVTTAGMKEGTNTQRLLP